MKNTKLVSELYEELNHAVYSTFEEMFSGLQNKEYDFAKLNEQVEFHEDKSFELPRITVTVCDFGNTSRRDVELSRMEVNAHGECTFWTNAYHVVGSNSRFDCELSKHEMFKVVDFFQKVLMTSRVKRFDDACYNK